MRGIRLSEQHGVNPSLAVCFVCNKETGEIILPGRLPGDVEAPRKGCWNKEPCVTCKELMEQGIILISINEKLSDDMQNPYRSGGWCVVKEEAVRRLFNEDQAMLKDVLEKRMAFVADEAWDMIDLPRG